MAYFDGLTAIYFNRDESGQYHYYPWGKLGKGYILADEKEYETFAAFTKNSLYVMFAALIACIVLDASFLVMGGVLAAWYGGLYVLIGTKTRGLPVSPLAYNRQEASARSARAHGPPVLIACFLVALGFVAIGIWLLSTDADPVTAWLGIGFFALCAGVIARKIRLALTDPAPR